MATPSKAFKAFRDLTDRLLLVPKAAVDQRIADYDAGRSRLARNQRPGRKPREVSDEAARQSR